MGKVREMLLVWRDEARSRGSKRSHVSSLERHQAHRLVNGAREFPGRMADDDDSMLVEDSSFEDNSMDGNVLRTESASASATSIIDSLNDLSSFSIDEDSSTHHANHHHNSAISIPPLLCAFLLKNAPFTSLSLSQEFFSSTSFDLIRHLVDNKKLARLTTVFSLGGSPVGGSNDDIDDFYSPKLSIESLTVGEHLNFRLSDSFLFSLFTSWTNLKDVRIGMDLEEICHTAQQWKGFVEESPLCLPHLQSLSMPILSHNFLLASILRGTTVGRGGSLRKLTLHQSLLMGAMANRRQRDMLSRCNPALSKAQTLIALYKPFLKELPSLTNLSNVTLINLHPGLSEALLERTPYLLSLTVSHSKEISPSLLFQICQLKELKSLTISGSTPSLVVLDKKQHILKPRFKLERLNVGEYRWTHELLSPMYFLSDDLRHLALGSGDLSSRSSSTMGNWRTGMMSSSSVMPGTTTVRPKVSQLQSLLVHYSTSCRRHMEIESTPFWKHLIISNYRTLSELRIKLCSPRFIAQLIQAAGLCEQLRSLHVDYLNTGASQILEIPIVHPQLLLKSVQHLSLNIFTISWSEYVKWLFLTPNIGRLPPGTFHEITWPSNLLQSAKNHPLRGQLYLLIVVVNGFLQKQLKEAVSGDEWEQGNALFKRVCIEPLRHMYNAMNSEDETENRIEHKKVMSELVVGIRVLIESYFDGVREV
eukprot:CAMPEP_0117447812 /NCGR_PEP_ID=MMETSP0759-20121206/7071_1 /TAXON_ID=63605 /ORGANISM="Percolomonas cosmopolitus, Strain WS" /LENGTH=703 /DNA_ID=CAMNT_0005240165 /DNA_START=350 /DNA_END=2461 /DNA_ORIENTATION=-